MRLKSKVMKISLVLCILGTLAAVSILWRQSSPARRSSSVMSFFLSNPAFAQEGEASFLEEEAGIAVYTNLDQKLDLTAAKSAFRTVEKETVTYLVGSVPVPGYEDNEADDVHCFMHKDGWMVAYYLRDEPTSKIMYWKNWDGRTISTKIEEGLTAAASTTGVAPTDVKYYHFKYPDANKLMIVADKDSFKLTIPNELVIHERSYSTQWKKGYGTNRLFINEQAVGSDIGLITLSQLKPDIPHNLKFTYSQLGGVVVFVFQEL